MPVDHSWSLTAALQKAANTWYWMLAWIVAGALFGFGFVWLRPAEYRAIAEIYIGLNAYRAPLYSQEISFSFYEFRNLDDYKNWQMSELEAVLVRDETLAAVQEVLGSLDPTWGALTPAQLRQHLRVAWSAPGVWQLQAVAAEPRLAEALAGAWQQVTVPRLEQMIASAGEALLLDIQLQENARQQDTLLIHQTTLTQAAAGLQTWLTEAPAADPLARARLSAWAAQAAGFDPGWQALLAEQPPAAASAAELNSWVQVVLARLLSDQALVAEQLATLQSRATELGADYTAANQASFGLAHTLVVEGMASQPPQAVPLRSTGLGLVTGALIGWLLWLLWQVLRIARRL